MFTIKPFVTTRLQGSAAVLNDVKKMVDNIYIINKVDLIVKYLSYFGGMFDVAVVLA